MNIIIETIIEVIGFYLIAFGIGVVLKWYAKMISWGIAEGWAKVKKNISLNLGDITIILKTKKTKK